MSFKVVIPARFAATRLPGKPLRPLAGAPMIYHVWARAVESGADEVIVATDDERIARVCSEFGATVCMTDAGHASGTDRIAQVAEELHWHAGVIVVNLQGDEPLMPPGNLRQVAGLLSLNPEADIGTLSMPITDEAAFRDPNVVKVVTDGRGRALYFSRSPVPCLRDEKGVPAIALRHLGIYAYRRAALTSLAMWPPCELETSERLEQLRALWNGLVIQVDVASEPAGIGVDTEADLAAVEARLQETAGSAPRS